MGRGFGSKILGKMNKDGDGLSLRFPHINLRNNVDGREVGRMKGRKMKKKNTIKKKGGRVGGRTRTKLSMYFSLVVHVKSPAAWRRNFLCSFANPRLTFSHYLICIF